MMSAQLDDLLGCARAHGATSDTREWIADLESMLAVAWELMTEEQRSAFCQHPEVLAIIEAAESSPTPSP
jgi:hypothetical protein